MKPSEQQINQWIYEYQNGSSLRAIARKCEVDKERIRHYLRGKITVRSKSEENRKYAIRESYFDQIDSQEKAYMLGFICADGNINRKRNTVSIGLNPKDRYILDHFAKQIYIDTYKIRDDIVKNNKRQTTTLRSTLFINSEKIRSKLIEYGITPAKSLTLKYPDVINGLSEELQKAFIRGYFDGDGCIAAVVLRNGKYKDYRIAFAGNRDFCTSLGNTIQLLTGVNTFLKPEKNIVSLNINGNKQVKTFCDWLFAGSTIHLIRKHQKYLELCDQARQLLDKQLSAFNELVGQKFYNLTIISKTNGKKHVNGVAFLCRCDCGKEKIIELRHIKKTKSCGCLIGKRKGL